MPTHNAARTLVDQLDALAAQACDRVWEVVVVNNRSTDATPELVRSRQPGWPGLRLVDAPDKQNRAYARNTGARAARGDGLLFCDADDIVAPGWLAAMAAALDEHDFVGGGLEVERLNQGAPWRPPPPNGASQPVLKFLPYVISCNLGLSREAFEKVGGFSEDFHSGQDVDLSWRLQLAGYRIYNVPEAIVHYRYRTSLRELWRQMVIYSEAHVNLFRHFAAHGMPRPSPKSVLRRYGRLLRQAARLPGMPRTEFLMWLRSVAICWGHLRGSLRYRTLYL